eukprot:39310-Prymnesium_polylepis.1
MDPNEFANAFRANVVPSLTAHIAAEVNTKYKEQFETTQLELEKCKSDLLTAQQQVIELSEYKMNAEIHSKNSCFRGQDGETQMIDKLHEMFSSEMIKDTHAPPHSGDCIVDIPFSDAKDLRILFDRKNYDQQAFQKKHVDKAISDAQGTNADIIFL